ncbi:MAG TPA: iron-containing redox enzyme family protein [Nitrososphaerales archaeon]|nr:iron-containing redox enzyme family protein [Nitrososphaerales archaeon]
MSHLVRNLDAEIERSSLLKHSFYKMWSEGKLSREHLAGYSREYFQLVRAVPELVESIGVFVNDAPTKAVVSGIMEEETEHVELWAKFAAALGVPRTALMGYHGTPKTKGALSGLRSATEESLCQGAAAMYAIESEQPKISRTKLDGLKAFYGMSGDEDGTIYFREHEVADVRHAAVWRSILQREVAGGDERASLEAAALSSSAQNTILDSVMETYVTPTIS